MDRGFTYSPIDLLKILESPRNTNQNYCWELDTLSLLRKFQENVRQAEILDFATAALVLQGFAKLYNHRINSLDKDTEAFILRLSSLSRVEEVQNEPENEEPVQEIVSVPVPAVIEKPKKPTKPAEEPMIDPITGEIIVPEKPSPSVKKSKPIDINVFLEQLFSELQKTLNHFDAESATNSIFTVVDRQLRRKCCDTFLKYLNEPIELMEVLRKFLNDEDPNLVLRPIEHKRLLVTKMGLLVDVRNEVFIPNLSMQDNMQLQIRVSLKEYLLEEIVRLTCHDDCLPQDNANLPQDAAQTEITLDSVIHENFTLDEGATSLVNDTQNNLVEVENLTQESGIITQDNSISSTQNDLEIENKNMTQESGIDTQDISIFSTQDSEMITSNTEIDSTLNQSSIVENQEEEKPSIDSMDTTSPLEEAEHNDDDDIQHSVEDTEALLVDCEAIRECQEATTSMTINKVQFMNIFGLSKRILRKKSFFRLPDDILEWARIHRNLDLKPKEVEKHSTKRKNDFKMKPRNKQILMKFINKNRRSSINKIHLEKLESQCFIPLVPIPSKNEAPTPTEEDVSPSPSGTQNTTIEVMENPNKDENLSSITQEMRGTTPLNEIFENNLLSSTSCLYSDSGVERGDQEHYEDDIETDSYKTLTHYSNVESGIFTDMTTSTRDNTPSCNQSTRNNSFFSEYHEDDITNMTIASATCTPSQINRALFNRFDIATQQLQEVPEGNFLNQVAERMQDYQEKERQLLQLYERVDKWHQSIRERLLQAKRRENWNVVVYEDRILNKVPVKPESIHFALLVPRKSHEEICRIFLATLILATEGNIIISKTFEDPWAVNNFTLSKAEKIVRNHEVMNAGMKNLSGSASQANMITSSCSLETSDQIPFLYLPYGSEKSDDEDGVQQNACDDQAFMKNFDNILNYYDSDQDELQPEARLNIEYDRPEPQVIRRRGRKPKIQPKKIGKNIYVFNNKEYDSSDLDNYVARIVKHVDAFEQRSKSQEVILCSDLPIVLNAPGSNRMIRNNNNPSSPKTKLSKSRRDELNSSRRRLYDSSSDSEDDNTSLSRLYTPRRLTTAKRKLTDNTRQCIDQEVIEIKNRLLNSGVQDQRVPPRLINFDRVAIKDVQNTITTTSSSIKRKSSERNTTDSYLKRFKIFDDEINESVSSKSNNYIKSGPSGSLEEDYAIPGPSGLQKNNQRYKIMSSDDDDDDDDDFLNDVRNKMNRKRSVNAVCSSTPFNKKSKVYVSPGTYGSNLNLSNIYQDSDYSD